MAFSGHNSVILVIYGTLFAPPCGRWIGWLMPCPQLPLIIFQLQVNLSVFMRSYFRQQFMHF